MDINHQVQLEILRQLLFLSKAHFSQLNKTDLTNDHFTFHLKRLVELGLVVKNNEMYELTPSGLEVAGRLDVNTLKIVRQPKIGVLIGVLKMEKGRTYVLLGKRLKEPGRGKLGFYAEKVRFGESLFDTAKRGLKEETGLDGEFKFRGLVHYMDSNSQSPTIDRLMNYFEATTISGELKETTLVSKNQWISYEEAYKIKNTWDNLPLDLDLYKKKELFFEERLASE